MLSSHGFDTSDRISTYHLDREGLPQRGDFHREHVNRPKKQPTSIVAVYARTVIGPRIFTRQVILDCSRSGNPYAVGVVGSKMHAGGTNNANSVQNTCTVYAL